MFVTLTIKKVPTQVVKRIKERAAANHRSLQGVLVQRKCPPLMVQRLCPLWIG
ncbi:MAG: FitA-like ribbon-helix-helix domain-containing protein [Candidatus Binataceae bacterium]